MSLSKVADKIEDLEEREDFVDSDSDEKEEVKELDLETTDASNEKE